MPLAWDDQRRLPPMIPSEEVAERQRREDLKAYRRYLVDTGAVKCLVKMYKHIAKHEMRLDNPKLTTEFLKEYQDEDPQSREILQLTRENETLREYNSVMEGQLEELAQQLETQQRLSTGRALWRALLSPEFWERVPEEEAPEGFGEGEGGVLRLGQIYQRLCGRKVDRATGLVPVEFLRPPFFSAEVSAVDVSKEAFCEWTAQAMPQAALAWCRDGLLPRLAKELSDEAPFEAEMLQAIQESGLYPENVAEVADVVDLDPGLREFLQALAEQFGGAA